MDLKLLIFAFFGLIVVSSCNQAHVTITPGNQGEVPAPPTTTPPAPPTPYVTLPTLSDETIAENGSAQFTFTIDSNLDGLTCSSSHISASSSNLTLVPLSNVTYSGTFPNCQVTVAPASGQSGTTSIELTVTDDDATESGTVSFDLTVLPNSAPALVLEDKLFIEGFSHDIFFDPGDSDFLDKHTWSATGLPSFATLDTNTGNISVNPQPGDSGSYAVSLTVTDSKGASDTQTFNIIVEAGGGSQVPVYINDHPAWLSAPSEYAYWLYRPAAYLARPTEKFCAIIFFHGLGRVGDGTNGADGLIKLTESIGATQNFPSSIIHEGKHFPCLVFSPQAIGGSHWQHFERVNLFITHVLENYPRIDLDRLYLTGVSHGGKGMTNYVGRRGDLVAAAVSTATAASPDIITYPYNYIRQDVNFWTFHTLNDNSHYPSFKTYMDSLMAIFSSSVGHGTALEDTLPPSGYYTATFSEINGWNWVSGETTNVDTTLSNEIVTLYHTGGHTAGDIAYVNDTMWDWLITQKLDRGVRFNDVSLSHPVVTNGAGALVTLTANIKDLDGTISQVTVDLSQVGGVSNEILVSDGNFGYALSFPVPAGLSNGTKEIVIRARDNEGNLKSFPVKLNVVDSILASGGQHDEVRVNFIHDSTIPGSLGWNHLKRAADEGNYNSKPENVDQYTRELTFSSGADSRMVLRWLTPTSTGNPTSNGVQTGDGVVPDDVLKDSIILNAGYEFIFNIEHLNAGLVYNVKLISSTTANNRSTRFEIDGVIRDIASTGNNSDLAVFNNVVPTPDGKINVKVRNTDNHTTNSTYLNGLIIEVVQP